MAARKTSHTIALKIEGAIYSLVLVATENEAHDVGQAIANSETIARVDVYGSRSGVSSSLLLYAWGQPEDAEVGS